MPLNLTHDTLDKMQEVARLEVLEDAIRGMRKQMTTEEGIDTASACMQNVRTAIRIIEEDLEEV